MKFWMIVLPFVLLLFAFFGFCFDYSLWSIAGKNIPWYADVIAGTVTNGFVVSVMVICWVMRLCGMEVPFVG